MTDQRLCAFCRQLRRDSTDAERALWRRLRARRVGAKFRRQHPLGPLREPDALVDAIVSALA